MDFIANYISQSFSNEMPDDQPPHPNYSEPGEAPPLNPNPNVPGPDSPEVNTGSRVGAEEEEGPDEEDVQKASSDE